MNARIINIDRSPKLHYINNSKKSANKSERGLFRNPGKENNLFCEKWKAANSSQGYEDKLYKNLIILSRFAEDVDKCQNSIESIKLQIYYEMLNKNINSIIDDALYTHGSGNLKTSASFQHNITVSNSFEELKKKTKIRVYTVVGIIESLKDIIKRAGETALIYSHENAVIAINQILELIRRD